MYRLRLHFIWLDNIFMAYWWLLQVDNVHDYKLLPLSPNKWPVWPLNDMFASNKWHVCLYTTLIVNISNYLLLKIIKMLYFKSTRWDISNNISYANIYMYILVEI
jgi:hypothetical protein